MTGYRQAEKVPCADLTDTTNRCKFTDTFQIGSLPWLGGDLLASRVYGESGALRILRESFRSLIRVETA